MATTWDVCCTPADGVLTQTFGVFLREKGGLWIRQSDIQGNRATVLLHEEPTEYEVAFAPIVNGVITAEKDWSIVRINPSTVDDFDDPESPQEFTARQSGGEVFFQWAPEDPKGPYLKQFEIRGIPGGGVSWDSALPLVIVPGDQTQARWPWWCAGEWSFICRAVTKQGRYSSDATIDSLIILHDEYFKEIAEIDEAGTSFANGTLDGLAVDGGALGIEELGATSTVTQATSTATWNTYLNHKGTGTYITDPQDAGADVFERIEIECIPGLGGTLPATAGFLIPRVIETPTTPRTKGAKGPASLVKGNGVPLAGMDVKIEVSTSHDGSAYTSWKRWVPGGLYRYRYVKLRITISSIGYRFPSFGTFKWRRYRRNLKDEGTAAILASDAGGSTVTLNQPFTENVVVNFQATAAGGAVLEIVSTSKTNFVVKAYDPVTNARMNATIHWHALGV